MHLDDEVEAIAEGARDATREERLHLAQCEACARALALATRVHATLQAQTMPEPPPSLVGSVLSHARRERWRAEQRLDLVFNVFVGCAVSLGVGAVWLVLSATGLMTLGNDVASILVRVMSETVRQSLPALPTYALAVTVFLSGLAVWWWAERGFEM
jgi:hypothetical protein